MDTQQEAAGGNQAGQVMGQVTGRECPALDADFVEMREEASKHCSGLSQVTPHLVLLEAPGRQEASSVPKIQPGVGER